MLADSDTALRLVADHALRFAIRAFCVSVRRKIPVAALVFKGAPLQQRSIAPTGASDIVLSCDIEAVRAMAPSATSVLAFCTDSLAVASRPEIRLTAGNLLTHLQDSAVRVAITIPGITARTALMERFLDACETELAGSSDPIRSKARVILAAEGVAWGPRQVMELLGSGEADIVLGTRSMLRSLSAVADVVIPAAPLAVSLCCGLAIVAESPSRQAIAWQFVQGLLAPPGQAILERHGFGPAPRTAIVLAGAPARAVM